MSRFLLLAAFACNGEEPAPTDTDADTDADSDTDADTDSDTDTDSDADTDTEATSMACEGEVGFWRVGGAATLVTVEIDTVDPTTTFDPASFAAGVDTWPATPDAFQVTSLPQLDDGDDEFPCTAPPEDFACPQMVVDSAGADFLVIVVSASPQYCADPTVEYVLSATDADGVARTTTFLGNVAQ